MGLFDAIPRPKTKFGRFVAIISGVGIGLIALYYLVLKIDIVPDIGPLGYLDDIIVMILLVVAVINFVKHVQGRYTSAASQYKKWFRKLSIKSLLDPKLWLTLILLAAAFAYFFWTLDIIPDTVAGLGYLDDVIVAITTLAGWIRLFHSRRVRK